MNYYIDFDHTLFNTPELTKRMLQAIENTSKMYLLDECKMMFNRNHIYNIYELAHFFADKYNLNENDLQSAINYEINNCSDLVFEDGITFIQKLREKNHKVFLISYYGHELQYQVSKIVGSYLSDLFNGIIITKEKKYDLDIIYENGIFIDDKPSDLIGLYSKHPIKLIRIRRENHKYSDQETGLNIEEYTNFNEIVID